MEYSGQVPSAHFYYQFLQEGAEFYLSFVLTVEMETWGEDRVAFPGGWLRLFAPLAFIMTSPTTCLICVYHLS